MHVCARAYEPVMIFIVLSNLSVDVNYLLCVGGESGDEESSDQESDEEEDVEEDDSDSGDDDSLDGLAPTPKRRKLASQRGLEKSLKTGLYPKFVGVEGPVEHHNPKEFSALDLLWPSFLCDLIAIETNRYAQQNGRVNFIDTTGSEVWTFLGLIILMGIHRLPQLRNYWSRKPILSVPTVSETMSLSRCWELWSNFHCVDNRQAAPDGGISRKIQIILGTLSVNFLKHYNPSQELSVDEAMVKYKGRAKGKIKMPKKPVKLGFKVWCCSCSCCGYLCTFDVYHGKPTDPKTGLKIKETGLDMRYVRPSDQADHRQMVHSSMHDCMVRYADESQV